MSPVDQTQAELEALTLDDKLHVFDIHTDHNLHPPTGPPLRVSQDLIVFLDGEEEKIDELVKKPSLKPVQTDNSYPLTDYFISSSHNTYLLARQIVGKSSAECYPHVLRRGCRCVEIDVWPSSSGPVVTHGYTLSASVPFATVCQSIGDFLDKTYGPYKKSFFGTRKQGLDFPVLISLECHVPPSGQGELVNIMKEVWGDRLVDGPVHGVEDDRVTPGDLKGRIVVMVEYYVPRLGRSGSTDGSIEQPRADDKKKPWWKLGFDDDSSSSSDGGSSEDEESQFFWNNNDEDAEKSSLWPIRRKKGDQGDDESGDAGKEKEKEKVKISDELAALGYYARSMKPGKGWLGEIFSDPRHVLINISESACSRLLNAVSEDKPGSHEYPEKHAHILHLPSPLESLIDHASHHLRRIFPRGTRIASSNLDPSRFWRTGSQVVSLNWQKYDRGIQMNEGLFVGSPGWVLKPKILRRESTTAVRASGTPPAKPNTVKFKAEIVGASSLPAPNGRHGKTFHTYLRAELYYHRPTDLGVPAVAVAEAGAEALSRALPSLEEVKLRWQTKSIKVQHVADQGADALWKDQWEWEYEADELAFIRLLIYEHEFGKDDRIVSFCSPVDRLVVGEWLVVRMLDPKGKDVGASVVVRFNVENEAAA